MVSLNDPATVLFGRTRRAILSLLFTRPDESFYLREIVRRTGGGIGAIQRESSDVDVMVIGMDDHLTLEDVAALLSKVQEGLGREINPFVLSAREFRSKWRAKNHFIRRVVEGEKIFLIGGADELKRLAEE